MNGPIPGRVYKTWSFYDATGLFVGRTFTGPSENLEMNTPQGHAAMEGVHDHLSRRVDLETGETVDWQPPQPSADHVWNADTKRWQLHQAVQDKLVRRQAAVGRIAALEALQARPLRELARDPSSAEARKRLAAIEAEIAALRIDLA
jgi:hypothetical protein